VRLLLAGVFASAAAASISLHGPRPSSMQALSLAKWTYTEAFAPVNRFIKHAPSGQAPLAMHVAAANTNHLHVYVLTASTLECWLVGGGGTGRAWSHRVGAEVEEVGVTKHCII